MRMLKFGTFAQPRHLIALTLAAGLSAPAFAAGLDDLVVAPVVAAPVVAATPAPSYAANGDWSGFYGGLSLGYGDVTGSSVIGDDMNGLTYGVHGGYNYDFGTFVMGGEIEYSGSDITDDTIDLDVESVLRGKLRLGYDAGQFMPYAVVGAAQLTTTGAIDDKDDGYLYGVGIDYAFSDNLVMGAELLQHEFEDYTGSGIDVSATTAAARISYRF
jgi:outer membrane immunogenic protein